jgi:proline dehydrogenase
MKYNSGSFSDVFNTDLGQRLWAYLNEPTTVAQMETATLLGRPAAEPLGALTTPPSAPGLVQQFGQAVRKDRIKQMIGNMIRQIMEARGYRIDRQNVRMRDENMFSSATRYLYDAPPQALSA